MNRLRLFEEIIRKNAIFDANHVTQAMSVAENMEHELRAIHARPFLWDASERNVIIDNNKIAGIVDVDDLCFGDPLFVLALTYVALENEGHDTLYADYWAEALQLDEKAQFRLEFYRLFYAIVFMRQQTMTTTNRKIINHNISRLQNMFKKSLLKLMVF